MTAKGDPHAPVPGTTLGQGFRLMAQALLEIAQQMKLANQMTWLKLNTDNHVMFVSDEDQAAFDAIKSQIWKAPPA